MQSIILWVVAERQLVAEQEKEKKVDYRSYAVAIGQVTMNRVPYVHLCKVQGRVCHIW